METLKELVNLSPPVALMVFLFMFGVVMKRSRFVPDRMIPIVQMLSGMVTYPLISEAVPTGYYYPLASKIFLGGLLGGSTVAFHQTIKQFLKRKGIVLDGDTEIVSKDTVSTVQTVTQSTTETKQEK